MIIYNGFVRTLIGDWLNLSKVHGFSINYEGNEKHIVVALLKPTDTVDSIGLCEYDTDKEAQDALDASFNYKE